MKISTNIFAAAVTASVLSLGASQAHADFSGLYLGLQVGYGQTEGEVEGSIGGTTFSGNDEERGINYGALVGYGIQFNSIYVGAEIDASWSDAEYTETSAGITGTIEQKHTIGAAARVGYVINNSTMIYLRGGLVRTKFDASLTDGTSTVSESDSFNGFRFGGGVDFMFNANLGMRLEYTHTSYGDKTYTSGADSVGVEFDEDILRLAVTYKF